MAFVVEVGSDLYGTKHNLMLSFPHRPSLWEFRSALEAQFDVKSRSCRPAGYPDVPFKVETLQVFGDHGAWVDLLRDDQLRPNCQVWVFQPESIWHSDAQGVIPKPDTATTAWQARPGSPARGRPAGADTGCPPTLVEKMTAVFHEVDGQGKGFLLRDDVERAFQRAEMAFASYGDAFHTADLNRSGHITWDEWQQFAISNPSVVDALFFRLKDAPNYAAPPPVQYVTAQPGYGGTPVPYQPVPAGTYSSPQAPMPVQRAPVQQMMPPPQMVPQQMAPQQMMPQQMAPQYADPRMSMGGPFSIECGSDLYGTKHNIIINFPHRPSLHEVRASLEAQFDVKARACRPAGYPDVPFKVETLQVFGEQGAWVDLLQESQLRPNCQVWVFQPESIWHSDAQGVIPKPDASATTWQPRPGSPSRQRAATDTGCPPTLVEKMTAVFHQIDGQGKGFLHAQDIERAFAHAEMQFSQYGSSFAPLGGHVTWDQWQQFAIQNPGVVDALFFRMKDAGHNLNYTAPPPAQYVTAQRGYPGSPVAYQPVPAGTYGSPPAPAPRGPSQGYTAAPAPAYGTGYAAYGDSPQRRRAQSEYEQARARADRARMEKEMAEGDERRAWDRLYSTPQ